MILQTSVTHEKSDKSWMNMYTHTFATQVSLCVSSMKISADDQNTQTSTVLKILKTSINLLFIKIDILTFSIQAAPCSSPSPHTKYSSAHTFLISSLRPAKWNNGDDNNMLAGIVQPRTHEKRLTSCLHKLSATNWTNFQFENPITRKLHNSHLSFLPWCTEHSGRRRSVNWTKVVYPPPPISEPLFRKRFVSKFLVLVNFLRCLLRQCWFPLFASYLLWYVEYDLVLRYLLKSRLISELSNRNRNGIGWTVVHRTICKRNQLLKYRHLYIHACLFLYNLKISSV